jgi:S-adenosylmethionine:tRNA ribosyltransferase-isomerase
LSLGPHVSEHRLEDFDFDLPERLIALRPHEPRDQARLLHVAKDGFEDRRIADLPDLLRPGDVLVFNDTRVIPARLKGRRLRGDAATAVEATLLSQVEDGVWTSFMRPGRRLASGDRLVFGEDETLTGAVVDKRDDGQVVIRFDLSGPRLDAAIREVGDTPLPPYIAQKRAPDDRDRNDYQTVYARNDGSVAAPTAGLHFTAPLMDALQARGIAVAFVTLHVGAGTFLPVKSQDISKHRMHAEFGVVSQAAALRLNQTWERGGRVIAVGTTSARLLESAATKRHRIEPFQGETDIFIRPGHMFRAVDGLISNFHLPRSTLLMLMSAFAGYEPVRAAYAHAITSHYRFFSYGDAGLWWPTQAL